MDTMDFDSIDTTDIDDERRFVAFVKKHAKLYQVGTDTGVRRLQTKLKKFNIKDKSLPKSKRKDKMVLDGSRTTEVEKQSKTKMDTEVDEPLPMPERKGKMVLDESSTTGAPGLSGIEGLEATSDPVIEELQPITQTAIIEQLRSLTDTLATMQQNQSLLMETVLALQKKSTTPPPPQAETEGTHPTGSQTETRDNQTGEGAQNLQSKETPTPPRD
ncbi:hypothetical protein RHGRI_022203 [Rhododendron griersonianum]|uniref:Transposase n=1 Tax=Rhododendron griersonianum TaxID=479676 RepID=A0AAV6JSB2_9ERIC|nr:hypothetical protein RHGRI_022203 [Rhododendron griersonianum]